METTLTYIPTAYTVPVSSINSTLVCDDLCSASLKHSGVSYQAYTTPYYYVLPGTTVVGVLASMITYLCSSPALQRPPFDASAPASWLGGTQRCTPCSRRGPKAWPWALPPGGCRARSDRMSAASPRQVASERGKKQTRLELRFWDARVFGKCARSRLNTL